eukprot:CAMPEP_0206136708 /NCGR_PEP_ID=MMETSP1473-20131121/1946_1 /ASSEMBLY_ACC=CAM_ASM_001109 /TAXON_ID=1461547 /ORGANISM="Stichococcus sp, Strain RCC1054" /LENGTH=110 /DNA_ID=CAMNT_0053529439 /DNA_START=104 /DNA_END=436 /DNA_ORIENTATION=-
MTAVCGMPCLAAPRTCRIQRPLRVQAARLFSSTPLRSISSPQRTARLAPSPRSSTVAQAMPIAELANEFTEIASTATVMFAITLVGLAAGFVLLRYEALVEEGKLDDLLK